MGYDPRSIAYISELIHPPLQHKNETLHSIYSDIFKEKGMGYQNFNFIQGGAQLSTPPAKGRVTSSSVFLPDRVRVHEELPQFTLDDFSRKVLKVMEIFLRYVRVPVFSVHQVVIRSLVTPKSTKDSRVFLGQTICGLERESLEAFRRPSNFFGLRFVFPQSAEEKSIFNVRVESFSQDTRSVFIENGGVFLTPIPPPSLSLVEKNIQEAYRFLSDNVCSFLERFDK